MDSSQEILFADDESHAPKWPRARLENSFCPPWLNIRPFPPLKSQTMTSMPPAQSDLLSQAGALLSDMAVDSRFKMNESAVSTRLDLIAKEIEEFEAAEAARKAKKNSEVDTGTLFKAVVS